MPRSLFLVSVGLMTALVAASNAQAPARFRARLSPVPIDVAMQRTIAGDGSVTATLSGTTLVVAGSFANLKSPATTARLHAGAKGIRGPAVLDLTVTQGTSGKIAGRFELTPAQMADLRASGLYVQVNSEGAPDGNLWGWLLPAGEKR